MGALWLSHLDCDVGDFVFNVDRRIAERIDIVINAACRCCAGGCCASDIYRIICPAAHSYCVCVTGQRLDISLVSVSWVLSITLSSMVSML